MTIRAKLTVSEITQTSYAPDSRKIVLRAEYDTSIPEDQRFHDATPNGTLEMFVNNPAALAELKMGQAFYVDFTAVPDAAS